MATINYENKEALNVNPTIPNKNKVVDSDMNLIKQVGNQILTTMGVYTDTWSSSATYNVDEIAIYDNRIFKNLTGTNTATTPDQDTTNWQETTLASMSGGGGGGVTGDTLPIGSQIPYGSTTPPSNWLVCDGSAVSRTTYAELFAVIGTSYGAGDGSTTFNLPNKKGRKSVGYDSNDTDFNAIGKKGGEKTHTLTENEMPSHNHNRIRLIEGNQFLGRAGGSNSNVAGLTLNNGQYPYDNTTYNNADTSYTGGGQPHNNEDPYETDCWIIKAKQSAGVVANVSNTYSTSETDTYSCDYINGIVESGANANGYYTKYTDGTLICRYFVGPITTNAGAGTTTPVTFPYEFINTDWQTQLTMTNGQAYWSNVACNVSDKSKTGFNLKTWNNGGGTNSGQYFDYVAIGRWK